MPYVLKTAPLNTENGGAVQICERPFYGGANVDVGDEAFIWFSETQGGNGLAWSGIIEHVEPFDRRICVTVRTSNRVSNRLFTIANLEPFRLMADGAPMSELARKLYRHSHNKICQVTADEADLLRSFMA